MSKFFVIGDIHIRVKYIAEIEKTLNKILDIASERENDYDFIVILGDIYDRHERLSISELMTFDNFIKKLMKITEKNIFILIGNHDRPKNTCFMTDEHALNPYKTYSSIKIVDHTIDSGEYLFVPYVPVGRFADAIADYVDKLSDYKCIFTHQEFKDVSLGKIKSKKGDQIAPWLKVINGHIHNYERLGNIICVGSVHQIAFNEDKLKTVSIFHFDHACKDHTCEDHVEENLVEEDLVEENLVEERIECNPVKNVEIHLNSEELISFNIYELLQGNENRFKLIVDSERKEVAHMLEECKNNPRIKIQFSSKNIGNKDMLKKDGKRKTYIDYLAELLQNKLDIRNMFENMFGVLPVVEQKIFPVVEQKVFPIIDMEFID